MVNDKNYPDPDLSLDPNDVVSTTECTGLLQGMPMETDVIENYKAIYDIPDQGTLETLERKLQIKNPKTTK